MASPSILPGTEPTPRELWLSRDGHNFAIPDHCAGAPIEFIHGGDFIMSVASRRRGRRGQARSPSVLRGFGMFSFGPAGTHRAAAALAVALVTGPALAQTAAQDSAPAQVAAPAEAAADATHENPAEAPAEPAAPTAMAAPPAPTAAELQGPNKPAVNQSIRDALARDESEAR